MIVVPTRTPSCPPTRALIIEGYEVTEVVMGDPTHYSRLMAELWDKGEGFVVVEDDVVPWPGAIKRMLECEKDWCGYQHPRINTEPGNWAIGLGCIKFSSQVIRQHPIAWTELRWDEVTGPIDAALMDETIHLHYPPVAHIKSHVTRLRL